MTNNILRSLQQHFVRISACLFTLLCVFTAPLSAQQSNPIIGQKAKSNSDLETRNVDLTLQDKPISAIIEALSDQIGHGIVLDGKPLLARGSFKLHTSAKSALDQVAECFDCSWTSGKHGVILMSKRFHQPDDLPQIHLKEMQKMAADLLSIWPEDASKARLSHYPFTTVRISPGNALFRTFSSDQVKYLNDGHVLTYQELTAEQKDLIHLCILNGASGDSHDIWDGLNARLAKMPESYLQWRSWFHNRLDQHPTPFQYSLEYIWPDLQDKGYERLLTARKVLEATREKQK